jgi:predicted nucleotidyltransferase component of viral defense system
MSKNLKNKEFSAAFQIGEPKKHKIHKLSRIHLDVGFGDQLVTEAKQESMLPLFSEHEPISWSIYPIEQIIAEKLETLFSRGPTNSRARDIYDLVHLLPRSKNDKLLLSSITITFEERNTPLPSSFAKEAQKLNSPVMEMAWNSVRVLKNKTSFAEIWETLLEYLKQFDKK